MNINRKMLFINKYSRPGRFIGDDVRGVVVHYVNNPGSSPEQNINYWNNLRLQQPKPGERENPNAVYASAHFVVGINGDIWQCIPTNEMAYHCGAMIYKPGIQDKLGTYPNAHTIGIELCHLDADGCFTRNTFVSAAELAAKLLKEYALDPHKNMFRHFDVTGKICPKWFVEHENHWELFIESVAASMD